MVGRDETSTSLIGSSNGMLEPKYSRPVPGSPGNRVPGGMEGDGLGDGCQVLRLPFGRILPASGSPEHPTTPRRVVAASLRPARLSSSRRLGVFSLLFTDRPVESARDAGTPRAVPPREWR